MATITLSGNTYTLITLPTTPAPAAISITMSDAVAVVESPFVPAQVQTQIWPGADRWSMEIQLPKMARVTAMPWLAFLASLQGTTNVFQIGDPLGKQPLGTAQGAPLVDAAGSSNAIGSIVLASRGWLPSIYRLLMPGDYIQVGYRFYQITAQVNADSSGKALLSIWPSLRETPADATQISLIAPVGVFRLASNRRQWHASPSTLTDVSFTCTEVI